MLTYPEQNAYLQGILEFQGSKAVACIEQWVLPDFSSAAGYEMLFLSNVAASLVMEGYGSYPLHKGQSSVELQLTRMQHCLLLLRVICSSRPFPWLNQR